jgi:hypothetical protein
MNRDKLRRAEKVTDTVVDAWNEAQGALKTLWVNGAGVLTDPSMVRSDLWTAANAIKRALEAMNFSDWPREADYE